MSTKKWLQMIATMKPAQLREIGEICLGMADAGPRDEAQEQRMQELINSLPDPPHDGSAERLKQARLAAGRCCKCGNRPAIETMTEEQSR